MSVSTPALTEFSKQIDTLDLMPLWERPAGMMQPGSACIPAHWRWSDMKPHLLRSSELITKKDAERRVLVLENPSLRGSTQITNTLYAGLQIILPGEIAPSHRHTANALRFVVEGDGAYTAVDGEKIPMHPGDFVVTPNWSWHDHGNLGDAPVVWLDGLDTPFTRFFGANFREDLDNDRQNLFRQEGDMLAAFGSNMLPADYTPQSASSPVMHYPYERSRAALAHLAATNDPHPVHGTRLRYSNPATGRHPFSTIAAYMQMLPAKFRGQPYRTTEGIIFCVMEGAARVSAGGQTFEAGPKDVFVIPGWTTYTFQTDDAAVIFSYSDRAGQEALGFWREEIPA